MLPFQPSQFLLSPVISSCGVLVSRLFDLRDTAFMFGLADFARERPAGLLEAGKIPEVRKITALLRLHRLHRAIFAFQKNARAVRLFLQGQPAAIPAQPGEPLDEIRFAQAVERGEARDFRVRQTHLARPAAAGRATLALIKNRHAENYPNGIKSSSPALPDEIGGVGPDFLEDDDG